MNQFRGCIIKRLVSFNFVIIPLLSGAQAVYYIDSYLGSDTNPGTQVLPFKTIAKGISALGTNIGSIYLRSGTYLVSSKINLTQSGQVNQLIKIWSYNNEKVIIDFTGNLSDGFSISGSFYHLKGLDIRNAGHNGINISGNNNIIENCVTRNCSNTGLHLTGSTAPGPSNNLILNCDSFYNFDSPVGGNADGFSAKWNVGSGNIFRGCRAYNNSDDGWDLWMCTGSILIESCIAFRNGVDIWHTGLFDGNGNGFKLGGNYVATPHTVKNCIAFDNAGNGGKGFDENNNTAGQTIYNCTSFRNKNYNYAFYNDPLISGIHTIKNCISFLPGKVDIIKNAIQEKNTWQNFTVTSADFISTDTSGFVANRDADGKIPFSSFLRLSSGSLLIDSGVDVGIPFTGVAPDIGAYEYSSTNVISSMADSFRIISVTQNYPNPFDNETALTYQLSRKAKVSIHIYNVLGSNVASIYNQLEYEGTHQVKFITTNWEAGLYYYTINAGNEKSCGKLIKINL